MNNDKRIDLLAREGLLRLLSDDEIARVSTAEAETRLANGDEYIDLERPDDGIQRATLDAPTPNHVLPRKSVGSGTWTNLVAALAAPVSSKAPRVVMI